MHLLIGIRYRKHVLRFLQLPRMVLASRVEEVFGVCRVFEFGTIRWLRCLYARGSATDSYGLLYAFDPKFAHLRMFTRALGVRLLPFARRYHGIFRTIEGMGFFVFFPPVIRSPRVLDSNMPFVDPRNPATKKTKFPFVKSSEISHSI